MWLRDERPGGTNRRLPWCLVPWTIGALLVKAGRGFGKGWRPHRCQRPYPAIHAGFPPARSRDSPLPNWLRIFRGCRMRRSAASVWEW